MNYLHYVIIFTYKINLKTMPPTSNQTDSAFANFLINKGIVKTESGANIIMIIFVIAGFAYTIKSIF